MSKKNENDNEDIFMTSDGSHISMITEITEDVNPETEKNHRDDKEYNRSPDYYSGNCP